MKIRPVQAVLFDAVRHDEAYSHFSQLWERAENIRDKTYVKPLWNILHDSIDLVRFTIECISYRYSGLTVLTV